MKLSRWLPWMRQKSHLFGHHLCFAIPRYELTFGHRQAFRPTVSTRCGEETLAFYDSVYDTRSGAVLRQFLSEDESALAALEAKCNASGIPDELSLARRMYCNCSSESELSEFLDIWVHRNGHCGDLRDPANLRRAAEVYITQESLAMRAAERRAAEEEGWAGDGDGNLFDEGKSENHEVHGVNWRQRDLNGRCWQLYEEYGRQYIGESWLLPLGEQHFLRVHLYGTGSWSPPREALRQLHAFIERSMRRFRVHSPDAERERPGGIDIEPMAAPAALDRRRALEEKTARMPYLIELAEPRMRQPLFRFDSLWWWLVGAVCLVRGFVGAVQYLGWEQLATITAILGIAGRIQQRLKKLAQNQ